MRFIDIEKIFGWQKMLILRRSAILDIFKYSTVEKTPLLHRN